PPRRAPARQRELERGGGRVEPLQAGRRRHGGGSGGGAPARSRESPHRAQPGRGGPSPPPHDTAAFDRQLALRQRIEHLAATTNRLPVLEGRLLPAKRAHAATLRLLAAAAQRALQALAAAWGVVDATAADHVPPTASLQRLEEATAALEIALARRRTPWWEVEG
ncbi:MAG: hypothetical protein ACK5XM_17305, partial [Betaproteobacteria bacterium]